MQVLSQDQVEPTASKSVSLETGMTPSDIMLDCFHGHITLMEFQRLNTVADAQMDGFVEAFHNLVYDALMLEASKWETRVTIKIKAGWVGNSLLLIGFKNEVSLDLATSRMEALTKVFAGIRHIKYGGPGYQPSHEVFLKNLDPIHTMVTRPKLMNYTSLAGILISDLQLRKSAQADIAVSACGLKKSALWLTNPIYAANNSGPRPDDTEIVHQENTKRFLRKALRDHQLNLIATPVLDAVTESWAGLSVSPSSLNTADDSSTLPHAELTDVCGSLGMHWELDTALIDQALAQLRNHGEQDLPRSFQLNIPVHWETVLCWSFFPADLKDILDRYSPSLTEKICIVIQDLGTAVDQLERRQLEKIRQRVEETVLRYGIEFYGEWDSNDDASTAAWLAFPLSGIRLTDRENTAQATKRAETIIDSRNRYNTSLKILLGTDFVGAESNMALRTGVELVEQPGTASNHLNLKQALLDLSQRRTTPEASEVIDARTRFLTFRR